MTRRWALEPLLEASRLSPNALRRELGIRWDTFTTASERGLSDKQADSGAVRCGLHPSMVWGSAWDESALTVRDLLFVEGGWRQAWLWREAHGELGEAA